MAIHTMCDESLAHYAVPGYSGHERGTCRHGKTCPHYAPLGRCVSDDSFREEIRIAGLYDDCVREGSYTDRCSGPTGALYMQISYIGCVLETRERNYHDDSDFYALVWDESEQRVRSVDYATTRGWTYPNHATVDATPEVCAKVEAWQLAQAKIAALARLESPRDCDLTPGTECELKSDCHTRAAVSEPCSKCAGLGYWQNPKRANDRRPCFGCNGAKVRKVAAPKGTPMAKHPKGKRGLVVRTFKNVSKYGTWDRGSRVELQAQSGELFTVSVDNVRIIPDPSSEETADGNRPSLVTSYCCI